MYIVQNGSMTKSRNKKIAAIKSHEALNRSRKLSSKSRANMKTAQKNAYKTKTSPSKLSETCSICKKIK